MNKDIEKLISKYWLNELSSEDVIKHLPFDITTKTTFIRQLFNDVLLNKDKEGVDYFLTLLAIVEKDNEFIDLIHTLLLEPWHSKYEEMAHNLQYRKSSLSIPFLKIAMQSKYDFLESYEIGTRQFINQCGHALRSIGTNEAIETVKELSKTIDPILKDEMLYRMSRIDGSNNYVRNFNL